MKELAFIAEQMINNITDTSITCASTFLYEL